MGPLEGIKIIDISTIVSGPLAASMLGDQGAEVIKIEPPFRGENARVMGPIKEGSGALFAAVNRSKRSLALDLKQEESKKIILCWTKNPLCPPKLLFCRIFFSKFRFVTRKLELFLKCPITLMW